MDGQSGSGFSGDSYIDPSGSFYVFGSELKIQDLAKPQFAPSPEHYVQDATNTTPELSTYSEAQRFADLEKLSSEFTPEYTDPLVGELKSSKELAIEYAGADPIYVQKTSALYPAYTHYRKIRGDGNCAWRAIAFGYFELLLRSGKVETINREWARLVSLENLIKKTLAVPELVYEDFATDTFEVFKVVSDVTMNEDPNAMAELMRIFNENSNSIIAYFKLLTSTWMKTRPTDYANYLLIPVDDYCANIINPFAVELDHVGVKALIDCLILPAEMRVEISYLDRSAGAEVNVHHFDSGENPFAPILRLLYRPGHYDIIYKFGDLNDVTSIIEKVQTSSLQVSFMPTLPEQYFQNTPLNYLFNPIPHGAGVERRGDDRDRFRASLFQYTQFQPSPLPFQTAIFRNSAYNPSHYQSENFQPELYQPENEKLSSQGGGRRRL